MNFHITSLPKTHSNVFITKCKEVRLDPNIDPLSGQSLKTPRKQKCNKEFVLISIPKCTCDDIPNFRENTKGSDYYQILISLTRKLLAMALHKFDLDILTFIVEIIFPLVHRTLILLVTNVHATSLLSLMFKLLTRICNKDLKEIIYYFSHKMHSKYPSFENFDIEMGYDPCMPKEKVVGIISEEAKNKSQNLMKVKTINNDKKEDISNTLTGENNSTSNKSVSTEKKYKHIKSKRLFRNLYKGIYKDITVKNRKQKKWELLSLKWNEIRKNVLAIKGNKHMLICSLGPFLCGLICDLVGNLQSQIPIPWNFGTSLSPKKGIVPLVEIVIDNKGYSCTKWLENMEINADSLIKHHHK
jgi:hypothetical protein